VSSPPAPCARAPTVGQPVPSAAASRRRQLYPIIISSVRGVVLEQSTLPAAQKGEAKGSQVHASLPSLACIALTC
jgi:hypothetical protein